MVFRWQPEADYPLVLVANRDEWFARPTALAHWWEDIPTIYAGRDLQAGGTWLGFNRTGQWGGLTNVRDPAKHQLHAPSRGALVQNFLAQAGEPLSYAQTLVTQGMNGFNLLLGCMARRMLVYRRDVNAPVQCLEAGLYAVSNAQLETPWWKVSRAKERLATVCEGSTWTTEALWEVLADTQIAPPDTWPTTGVDAVWEARLSALRIVSPESGYGTRTTTAICYHQSGEVRIAERTWTLTGEVAHDSLMAYLITTR